MISNFVAKFCPNCKSEMVGIVKVSSSESEITCEDCDFVCIVRPSKAEREVATACESMFRADHGDILHCVRLKDHLLPHENGSWEWWDEAATPSLPEAVAGNASAPVGEPLHVFKEFENAVKYLQEHGYSDWDGTANGQEITLTGCANMMRQYKRDTLLAGQPSGVGEPRADLYKLAEGFDFESDERTWRLAKLLERVTAAPEVGEALREAVKQQVLGLSWIPLQYRLDVIRNVEGLLAAPAPKPAPPAPSDAQLVCGIGAHVLDSWQRKRVEREALRALEIVRAETFAVAVRRAAERKPPR